MNTTFVAISSMSGITCASDTDHTIYQLSKTQPLAVAVSPHSPIPWNHIINTYKRKGEPEFKHNFDDYVQEFFNLCLNLSKLPKDLSVEDRNIIFMGYGKDDLFPSVIDVLISLKEGNRIEIDEKIITTISHKERASIRCLGNLESVSTILSGATNETRQFLYQKHLEQFDVYKQRVTEKFKGTKYEDYVAQKFADYDPAQQMAEIIFETSNSCFDEIEIGLDSFSIEEMVTAAETIVDAEVRLDHLASGSMGPLHNTREIAVITRVEGLTWLKHSLYAL